MLKKIKNIFFLISFSTFIFFITNHYFSEQNIILMQKNRSSYSLISNLSNKNIPILKNDTNNIIIYKDGIDEFKEKRKKRFWEKLISRDNE